MTIDKSLYYYLILFATFLFTFAFIPLVFEIIQQKVTINIPYITLICMLISFLIYLFITLNRQYYYHIFLYLVGFICVAILLFLKRKFDNTSNNMNFMNIIKNRS